jgi:hypothetical protein
MTTRPSTRFAAIVLGLSALGMVAGSLWGQPGRARPQGPEPTRAATPPVAPEVLAEAKARAIEDVASLEAYLRAKAARVREADVRLALARDRQTALTRQRTKGIVSPMTQFQGDVSVAEADAERETRAAEHKDIEARFARAGRHLAQLERGIIPAPTPVDPEAIDGRVRPLERELDRMRAELDAVKRRLSAIEMAP